MNSCNGLLDLYRWFETDGEICHKIGIHLFGIGNRFLLGADTQNTEFAKVHMVAIKHEERDGFTHCKGAGNEGRLGDV